MFPEMTNKKVLTEDNIEIGEIVEIRPTDLGSFVVKIQTRFQEYPSIELPVTTLRKTEKDGDIVYILPNAMIPIKLKMLIEAEKEEEKEAEAPQILEAPEVPPLEQFQKKEEVEEVEKEEEKEVEEEIEEEEKEEAKVEEEVTKEEEEIEEKKEEEKKGFLQKLIEFIKKLFGKG